MELEAVDGTRQGTLCGFDSGLRSPVSVERTRYAVAHDESLDSVGPSGFDRQIVFIAVVAQAAVRDTGQVRSQVDFNVIAFAQAATESALLAKPGFVLLFCSSAALSASLDLRRRCVLGQAHSAFLAEH